MVEFQHYFAHKFEERRTVLQDDLLTDLINGQLEGETPLDAGEMLNILSQILVAGNETTTSVIASALLLPLQHPEQMQALRADHSLMPSYIERALRIESSVQGLSRTEKVDTEQFP